MIPTIKFRKMNLQENIDIIKWAFYEQNGSLSVHDFTVGYFTELSVFDNNTPQEEVYKKIEEVVTKEYNKYLDKIKSETKRYNDIWKKYNNKYFSMLSTYFEIEWPNIDVIEGTVGLIPVFPRYLDKFSFSISTGVEEWKLIETSAHETLHFIWFEKWKQIHPETPKREYDSPYITWEYSEMVTDPILNNKPFSEIFDNIFIERGYDSFYELTDNGNLVMDNLRNIYSENISVEDKMNKGFEYVKNILESINNNIK